VSGGAAVGIGRILAEHRLALGLLLVVLVLNAVALAAGVLPLSRAVDAAERRAAAADAERAAARLDVTAAEAMRTGRDQAVEDLDTFYADVLPADAAEARAMLHTALAQLAAAEGVNYLRLSASTDRPRDSALERMHTQMGLSGAYDDIRRFIHAIETGPGFVVINNMVLAEGSESGGQGLTLTLDLETYYRRLEADGR
jgi:Tfp pilus assembly protein PilO